MKLDFPWKNDGRYHEYCLACQAETVYPVDIDGQTHCGCRECGRVSPRSIIIDPAVSWWLDESGEYWHETAGVFVRNPDRQFLFFERTRFPFGLTVPAGHVNADETALAAAYRELHEEVSSEDESWQQGKAQGLEPIAADLLVGDSCRRGSDAHRWNSFLLVVDCPVDITVIDEGILPVWLTWDEAFASRLTFATRFVMERNAAALQR